MFFVYILYSPTHNRFYIGQTNNIEDRLHRHNSGYEKATSPYLPWEMKCVIRKNTRGEALILEKKLKNLSPDVNSGEVAPPVPVILTPLRGF